MCALKLFSLKGYEAVGIQEIVDNAKITKPTLYYYFGSKSGLLRSLINKYTFIMYDSILSSTEYNGDLKTTLTKICQSYFNFSKNNQEFYRMFLGMYYSPPESKENEIVLEINRKFFDMVEDVFIKASKDHGNMINRHKIYTFTFLGIINTYIGLSLNGYLELNEDSVYKAVNQFMHGIFS